MQSLPPLASEINRMIGYLAGAGAGLSLLSVATSSLPASVIQSLVKDSIRQTDVPGLLIDGSIGVLTVRPKAMGGEAELEQEFLDRLQPVMSDLSEKRIGGRVTLWLRAVHRPATEIAQASELIGCLFDATSTPLTINADSDSLSLFNPGNLFPRVPSILIPFIEPPPRNATTMRLLMDEQSFPPHFE